MKGNSICQVSSGVCSVKRQIIDSLTERKCLISAVFENRHVSRWHWQTKKCQNWGKWDQNHQINKLGLRPGGGSEGLRCIRPRRERSTSWEGKLIKQVDQVCPPSGDRWQQQQSLAGDNKHEVRRFRNYLSFAPLFRRTPVKLCSRATSC